MGERLKEIIEVHQQHLKGRGAELDNDDINWLIEQAEKAEELKVANTNLNKKIGSYSGGLSALTEELAFLNKRLTMLNNQMLNTQSED